MLISPNIPCTARFACKRPSIGEEAAIPAACSALKSQSFHLLSSCDRLSWHTTIRQQCPVSLSLSLALICSTCIHSNPLYTLVPAHIQWFQCIDPSSCHWIVSRTCAFHDLRGWTNRWDLLLNPLRICSHTSAVYFFWEAVYPCVSDVSQSQQVFYDISTVSLTRVSSIRAPGGKTGDWCRSL